MSFAAQDMSWIDAARRFANMDYIFASILKALHQLLWMFITYDIMCSWKVHLVERLKKLLPHVRLTIILALMRFAIPKMHIHAHTLLCQLLFSLNLLLGSAQVDAEGIEHAWAAIGAVATSTRNMGPGSRHDTLDCQWSYWNWLKLVNIGELARMLVISRSSCVGVVVALLRRRLERARVELKEQTEAFEEFSVQQAERVLEWKARVLEFELDEAKPNPYEISVEGGHCVF
jgi:hypothetical protein